jgi:hypothetical protein
MAFGIVVDLVVNLVIELVVNIINTLRFLVFSGFSIKRVPSEKNSKNHVLIYSIILYNRIKKCSIIRL